jgi:hypothetical protein
VAHAAPIGIGDLTGSETVEGFEGLATDANLTTWFGGWRTPVDGYVFPSGVIFDSMAPPNSNGDIIIGDTTIGGVQFGTSDGGLFPAFGVPPGGTAFIADDGPGEDMSFILPENVDLVGMYVVGTDALTINVYDSANVLLETAFFASPGTIATWATNFVGIKTPGIRRVEFITANDFWLGDNLTFAPSAVPEPTALMLLGGGLAAAAVRRRRRMR